MKNIEKLLHQLDELPYGTKETIVVSIYSVIMICALICGFIINNNNDI